jgi:hypothetical protein
MAPKTHIQPDKTFTVHIVAKENEFVERLVEPGLAASRGCHESKLKVISELLQAQLDFHNPQPYQIPGQTGERTQESKGKCLKRHRHTGGVV